ncbi:BamA/TamA family outer membrane protein [Larkinella terrae]|uniref:BamA/TamA family outer membrane protein n=1 Tax=Larkinella terrae TaxID=2025311 RepID=A0A7K0EQ99_9BACT|nr:BamA/TamA family outer membrane protein [Larkinella terrae]MRS63741.1 BamA/TamA family outer membrane protein [Larkinella terrae]
MKLLYTALFLLFLLPNLVTGQSKPYTVFLLGDAGEPQPQGDAVLKTLQSQLLKTGNNSSLIYLGDNIYPRGLPDSSHADRADAERRMREQLSILAGFRGKAFVIPGNHDWQQGKREGWQRIRNQASFVTAELGRNDVFFPKDGCPGPVEIALSEEITLVLIDTQWWLHPWDKPGEESDCEAKDLPSFLLLLDDVLSRNQNKKVVLAGHHPMYSHGEHGGHFTFKDHLFPLTDINPSLYIPLPVIGSIYPVYRTLIGNIQDIQHPKYKLMRNGMVSLLKKYRNVVYVNGHDHNEQLILRDSTYYVTSGSGSKSVPVKKGRNSLFASSNKGFARLDFTEDGKTTIRFFTPETGSESGKLLFETSFTLPVKPTPVAETATPPTSLYVIPSAQYVASPFHKMLLGDNYRDVWQSPVSVPILNLNQEAGGLKPLQRGGGMQTFSLRMAGKDGKEYVLRSVEKYAENAIPKALRSGFVNDLVQDQISASHPFAALVVPPLAEAAGVFHTNPKLVIVPDDSLLGPYRRTFAHSLALFEERVDGNYENSSQFGGTKKIFSTLKLLDKLADDNDNQVDQQAVLRARLFDIWLGDWDRHDDQWRWASFKNNKGLIFKPIPRDRDQAFFVNRGVIPKIVSRKWAMPKFQGFSNSIRDVPGLAFNARYFDRSFLTEPSLEDWIKTADSLAKQLTDPVIDEALKQLPNTAYDLTAAEIKAKLQSRRAELAQYAAALYRFLALDVDVTGSDKRERFEIIRELDGQMKVTVSKLKKEGETGERLYQRIFKPDETKEVRLYGMGGDDEFIVSGSSDKGILLRIIGGKGHDRIIDSSSVSGLRKKNVVYDSEKTKVDGDSETRLRLSGNPKINAYDRKAFKYNILFPQISVQYNPDDGLFLGGGFMYTKHGFRKEPFAQQHRFVVNHAFATQAYNFNYDGIFTDVIGNADLRIDADVQAPNFVSNFFGLGNATVFDKKKGITYYRTRFENISVSALIQHKVGNLNLYYGPAVESIEIEENDKRFVNDFASQLPDGQNLFSRRLYAGLKAGFLIDSRDDKILPTRGTYWRTELRLYEGISTYAKNLSRLQSDLAFYASLRLPTTLTIASRVGGGVNFSDYEFFQANTLGGLSNLRGFRRTRFAGGSMLYNNTELRLKVATIKTYLFPAYLGVLGFNDVGRVWEKGEHSTHWHHGYGGGVWLSPYKQAVISFLYAISEEEKLPMLRVGFLF